MRTAVAGAALSLAVAAGGVALASPPAQAARIVETSQQPGVVVIELSHADTVAAAHLGAGRVINALLGNDYWGVILETDSRYRARAYYRPDKAASWNDVTGHQVISEAAAHPGGRVVIAVYIDRTKSLNGHPLWIEQVW
ncbi:hypothetical protein O4159_21535 [Gordonia terrae]|nr:hypothetical protein [Gordonia terrae]